MNWTLKTRLLCRILFTYTSIKHKKFEECSLFCRDKLQWTQFSVWFSYLRFADPDDTPYLSSSIKLLLLKLIHHLHSLWFRLVWFRVWCAQFHSPTHHQQFIWSLATIWLNLFFVLEIYYYYYIFRLSFASLSHFVFCIVVIWATNKHLQCLVLVSFECTANENYPFEIIRTQTLSQTIHSNRIETQEKKTHTRKCLYIQQYWSDTKQQKRKIKIVAN